MQCLRPLQLLARALHRWAACACGAGKVRGRGGARSRSWRAPGARCPTRHSAPPDRHLHGGAWGMSGLVHVVGGGEGDALARA